MTAHILLVDDDDLLRRSLAFNLEKAGYRVSTAANAEAAVLGDYARRVSARLREDASNG